MPARITGLPIIVLICTLEVMVAQAQERDFSTVEIKTHPVADNIYMLEGSGGNIGLFTGTDGAFLIDDQFAPLTDKILVAIKAVTDQEVRLLINTHIHPDHVGGNENFGRMGALIVAHENVRTRMMQPGMNAVIGEIPPYPAAALPVITYRDGIMFHLNGEKVHVFPVPPAHTDGDSFIHFTHANVLHLGDVLRTTTYPFIDTSNGGNFLGIINAINIALELADGQTRIIPGHGMLTDKQTLIRIRDMYMDIRARIQVLVDEGLSLEQVLAAAPTADYDERWAGQGPTGSRDVFITSVYNELRE